ncbi:hypothetical protein QUH40_28890, partial [Klebsiella pneumoniae]|nr:hypothetical protein [Klebsiella pneumoniae]
QGRQVDEMPARALPSATHPYTRTLWTCRPNAHTYGQMLPTLDQINKQNVNQLQVAWVAHTGDIPQSNGSGAEDQNTPLQIG